MSSSSNDSYFLHNNWIEGEVKCMCNLPIKKKVGDLEVEVYMEQKHKYVAKGCHEGL